MDNTQNAGQPEPLRPAELIRGGELTFVAAMWGWALTALSMGFWNLFPLLDERARSVDGAQDAARGFQLLERGFMVGGLALICGRLLIRRKPGS